MQTNVGVAMVAKIYRGVTPSEVGSQPVINVIASQATVPLLLCVCSYEVGFRQGLKKRAAADFPSSLSSLSTSPMLINCLPALMQALGKRSAVRKNSLLLPGVS